MTHSLTTVIRSVLAVAFLLAVVCAPRPARATPVSIQNPAALIYAGWFGNTIPNPSFVAANQAFLETQPFDGLVIYMRNDSLTVSLTSGVFKTNPISYETAMSVLSPVANCTFTNLRENLGLLRAANPPDFFDDWSVLIQNFGTVARAAKDSGLKGFCFDNEQYSAPWGDYSSSTKYAATKTLAEYQAQARLRGKQVMEAMVAEFPNIVFLTMHGPYVSEPAAPTALKFPQWWSANELLGAFFVGHVEGAGTTGRVIDGGELYTLRTEDDFRASYSWRRNDIQSDSVNCAYLPAALRPTWADRSNISFGVYDGAFGGATVDAASLRSTLANAMRQADKYVWFYPEAATYLKAPDAGGASAEWVNAIRQAKADVAATAAPPATAPAAPSGLAASAVTPTAINLTWQDNSTNETGFQVERKAAVDGTWAPVATTAASITFLKDESVAAGTGHVYRIRSVNDIGVSAFCDPATVATPSIAQMIPPAPSNLAAAAASPFSVNLAWQDNSSNETGFQVERKTAIGGTWAVVATAEPGATTLKNSSLWSGTGYVYRLRAANGYGASAPSNEVTVTTPTISEAVPAAPTSLTASAASPFSIDLTWVDNASNETGYLVERKTVINGTWAQVASTGPNVTTLHNSWLWSATGYVYRVRATNDVGGSGYTNEATATTPYVQ